MKNKISFIALALASSFVAQGAQAASDTGKITFTGKVTDTTCTVSVNGGGADQTVTLPTVSTKQLATATSTAGRTNFSMSLSGCSAVGQSAAAFFESGPTVDAASGHLTNTAAAAGAATNVALQLIDVASDKVIKAGDVAQNTTKVTITDVGTTPATGSAVLNYAVEYYATADKVTAGDVSSHVTYSINYN